MCAVQISARQLLSGSVRPPPEVDVLTRILSSRVFSGNATGANYDDMYNDIPRYDDRRDDFVWDGAVAAGGHRRGSLDSARDPAGPVRGRAATWNDDSSARDRHPDDESAEFQRRHFTSTYSDSAAAAAADPGRKKGPAPPRPSAPKPAFKPTPAARARTLGVNQAVALYAFNAVEPGDLGIVLLSSVGAFFSQCLGFKKGDIITITKRSESKNVGAWRRLFSSFPRILTDGGE